MAWKKKSTLSLLEHLGTEEKVKEAVVKRSEIRDILGEKLVREVILK